jgi:myo-inositol-1(or 4)-monophosphatase
MTAEELQEILECAITAAGSGAKELIKRYGKPLVLSQKTSSADLVSDADLAAEKIVRKVISSVRPRDSISGEEYEDFEGTAPEVRWSIDPLDGTVNFSRGLPYFATSVGAVNIKTGKWIAGAVVAPALDVMYFASLGRGAYKESGQTRTRLLGPPPERTTKLVATGFSYIAAERVEQFSALSSEMTRFVDVRRMGSAALDICLVAEGSVDAYFEKHIKEHDWAAAMLIAEEAGLNVVRPSFIGDTGFVNFQQQ